jgi:hypothetical protein
LQDNNHYLPTAILYLVTNLMVLEEEEEEEEEEVLVFSGLSNLR